MSTLESRTESRSSGGPCKVMVVDDSAVIRGFFRRALESEEGIEVVASAGNGQLAVDALKRTPTDVILLDIEMPVLDGLSALPKLLEVDPSVKIIMASTLTVANADVSLRALANGAADYIPKPTTSAELHSSEDFRRELIAKVIGLSGARRGIKSARTVHDVAPAPSASPVKKPAAKIETRAASPVPASIIAIGSSTGGPQALMNVVSHLGSDLALPILITQHMPATFTGILAQRLSAASGRDAREAEDGEIIRPGRVYVAPGDYHMLAENSKEGPVLRLTQTPPENFCRPSVDPMLRSMADVYGQKLLAVILTGMGHDGLEGGRAVVEAGGTVIAQDEASSVVWGMPGAVAADGICAGVWPLDSIATQVRTLCGRAAK